MHSLPKQKREGAEKREKKKFHGQSGRTAHGKVRVRLSHDTHARESMAKIERAQLISYKWLYFTKLRGYIHFFPPFFEQASYVSLTYFTPFFSG